MRGNEVVEGRSERIGGWLILLVVTIGVLTPLAQLGSAMTLFGNAPRLEAYFGDAWPIYCSMTLGIVALRTIICLFVAERLIRSRSSQTPRTAIIGIWIAYVILGAVSLTVSAAFSPVSMSFAEMAGRLFWQLAICIVASAYLLNSKRVAATYSRLS